MSPSTNEHRGIEIRFGYDIATDGYRAHFVLPEDRRKQLGFQRVVNTDLPMAIEPGKHQVEGRTESEVLDNAHSVIDDYLGK